MRIKTLAALALALLPLLAACPRPVESASGLDASETPEGAKRACKGTCGGPLARVTRRRSPDGARQVYILEGSLTQCSHPPTSYFDEGGKELLVVPNRPVMPGDKQAEGWQKQREALLSGLTEERTWSCRN